MATPTPSDRALAVLLDVHETVGAVHVAGSPMDAFAVGLGAAACMISTVVPRAPARALAQDAPLPKSVIFQPPEVLVAPIARECCAVLNAEEADEEEQRRRCGHILVELYRLADALEVDLDEEMEALLETLSEQRKEQQL